MSERHCDKCGLREMKYLGQICQHEDCPVGRFRRGRTLTNWASKFCWFAQHWVSGDTAQSKMEVHGHVFHAGVHVVSPPNTHDLHVLYQELAAREMAKELDDGNPYQFCRAP